MKKADCKNPDQCMSEAIIDPGASEQDRRDALANLLNIIGRRQGALSVISIG